MRAVTPPEVVDGCVVIVLATSRGEFFLTFSALSAIFGASNQ